MTRCSGDVVGVAALPHGWDLGGLHDPGLVEAGKGHGLIGRQPQGEGQLDQAGQENCRPREGEARGHEELSQVGTGLHQGGEHGKGEDQGDSQGQQGVDQVPAQEGQVQLAELPLPAFHHGYALPDRGGCSQLRVVDEQIGGHGIAVADPQRAEEGAAHGQQREEQHPDAGGYQTGEQEQHQGVGEGKGHGPAQGGEKDDDIHQDHPAGHGEAVNEGAIPGGLLAVGPKGPPLVAKVHHCGVQDDQQGKKEGEGIQVKRREPDAGRPRQIGYGGHAGGQQEIDQRDLPEGGVGRAEPLPGAGL